MELEISDDLEELQFSNEENEENEDSSLSYTIYFFVELSRIIYRPDWMESLKSSQILYRQSLPISSWLPILEKMNTFYVENGSIINKARYEDWKKMKSLQGSISSKLDEFEFECFDNSQNTWK